MKIAELIRMLQLLDSNVDAEPVIRSLFPSMDSETCGDKVESSKGFQNLPSIDEIVNTLNADCIPSYCSTTNVGWSSGGNSIDFDDNEGGYDYRCEISFANDGSARIDFGNKDVFCCKDLDRMVEIIQEYWTCG